MMMIAGAILLISMGFVLGYYFIFQVYGEPL
jgi:hypothetical protein